jgi:exodeoxyribonuclease VII small subunit
MTTPELSFEQAYQQLTELVKKMESGSLPLADSVASYEQATKLKTYLEQMLKSAETKIQQLNPASE